MTTLTFSCHNVQVLEMGAHFFTSDVEDQLLALKDISSSLSTSDIFVEHQLQDLYEHFKVKVDDVQVVSCPLFVVILLFLPWKIEVRKNGCVTGEGYNALQFSDCHCIGEIWCFY